MLNDKEFYKLTTPQKSIYITEQYYKNTNINNVAGYLHIYEKINPEKIEYAINKFIKENEQFRARFFQNEKNVLNQYYADYRKENIKIYKLKDLDEKKIFEKEFCNKGFNIIENKLYRFCIYQLKNGEGGVIVSANHLICDAWSISLLINSIVNTYSNKEIEINEKYQYKKYIVDEQEYYKSENYKKDEQYWRDIFSDSDIEIVNKDLQEEDICAKRLETTIDGKLLENILKIDKSFFNLYMSALSIYFAKLNNQKNIIIGTPILNRKNYIEKQIVGMFVNTLPLKVNVERDITFNDFIKNNKKNEMQLFKHQKMPYERIMKFAKENNPQINTLFNITVSYQNARDNHKESSLNYNTGWVFNDCISDALDIHISDLDNTGNLKIMYDYQVNKFDESEIIKIHDRIINILKQASENTDILIKDIDIITEKEFKEIEKFNNNKIDFPKESNIVSKFKEQVQKNPDNIAISFEGELITYHELDMQSDRIAKVLLKNKIKKSDIVAIFLPRSLQYFISLLGILKVGGTYLPLDVEFPDSRINYILTDSKTKLCITDENEKQRIDKKINTLLYREASSIISNEEIDYPNINADDNCYIIYTSGTTRRSKRCSCIS